MQRRHFLALAAAAISRVSFAADLPKDVTITRIVAFDLPTQRTKLVGKNSRLDVHGDRSRDRIVRLFASDESEGFGCCHADEKVLASCLGKTPAEVMESGRLARRTAPLWDLMGKIAGKPAYVLFMADAKPQATAVPVYDGSIYFQDLLPEYLQTWKDRFKQEADETLKRGHRAFKVKIGRGAKWMQREEGDARDIEVLKLLREHVGKEIKIAVDANNGYGLDRTKKLLAALPDYNFDFIEEMFPEDVQQDLALKDYIQGKGLKTLIADGETQGSVEPLLPMMKAKAIDLFQLDVNAVGVDGLLEEAKACEPTGGRIAPHTWGTLCGFYAQLHVARAIPNFYSGEQDPLSSDIVIAEGYTIKDGKCTVPDAPGFGLKLDPAKLADVKPLLDLKA